MPTRWERRLQRLEAALRARGDESPMGRWMRSEARKLAGVRAATLDLARFTLQVAGRVEEAKALNEWDAPQALAEAAAALDEAKRDEIRAVLRALLEERPAAAR